MASAPLAPYTPRDDTGGFTAEENGLLDEVLAETKLPPSWRMSLVPFFRDSEWDEEEVARRVKALHAALDKAGEPTLEEVRRFMEVGADGVPPPCGALLEDGFGNCARDKRGNPIVVMYGNFECSADEAIRQWVFIYRRLERYAHDSQIPHVTYVFDMGPRASRHAVGSLNLAFLKFMFLFPQSYDMYVCAAPKSFVGAYHLIPPSMRAHTKVASDYQQLEDVIDPSNRLPTWGGGTFDFRLERYVEYLAA